MANEIIRPSALPARTNPVPSEVVPSDNNVTVGGVSWEDGVNSAVPPATQLESEAGVINSKRMTPLTTKQAIDAQVPPKISSAILALNLGSMSQETASDYTPTSGLAAVALSNEYGDLGSLPTLGTAAATAATDYATAAQKVPAGGSTGQVLAKASSADNDVSWVAAGAGDMQVAIYDPQSIGGDAFARANHTGTQPLSTIVFPDTQTKTSAYTLVSGDLSRIVLLSGTFTLATDPAATLGSKWRVQLRNIGTGIVTLNPNGSELIDGKLTVQILPGQTCDLISDGTAFYSIGLANGISTKFTASAASEIVIPLPDGYTSHEIMVHSIYPASDAQLHMQISINGGVTYINTNIGYTWSVYGAEAVPTEFNFGSNYADTKLQLTGTQRATGSSAINGSVVILNPLNTGYNKQFDWRISYSPSSSILQRLNGAGEVPTQSRITHVRLFHPSVNIASGTVTLRSVV